MDLDALLNETEALLNSSKPKRKSSTEQCNTTSSTATRFSQNTQKTVPIEHNHLHPTPQANKINSNRPRSQSDGERKVRDKPTSRVAKHRGSNDELGDELDDLLNSFKDSRPTITRSRPTSASSSRAVSKSPATTGGRQSNKCSLIVLTDATTLKGKCTTSRICSCSTMRCTSCDHAVGSFDNFVWHESADYLFFRNNFPNYDKLKSKLQHSLGSRAFACQCSCFSVQRDTSEKVDANTGLKWVCGRHTSA
eukprot:m.64436 g.64436  ORF g.64436 m.64436 type:complete len:251 (+) comp8115_c0_seq2:437-1189(+)